MLKRTVFILGLALGVVAAQPAYAVDRFEDNRDGTVTDAATDMVWIKDPSRIRALRDGLLWTQAMDVCRDLDYAGYGPNVWRLPSVKELETLVSEDRRSPRIAPIFQAYSAPYWSRTAYIGQGAKAWTVDFTNGRLGSHTKLSLLKPQRLYARCVRRGN